MKRIIVLFTVVVLMLVMSALPALAKNTGTEDGGPPTLSGNPAPNKTTVVHCNSDFFGGEGATVFNKNGPQTHGGGNCAQIP